MKYLKKYYKYNEELTFTKSVSTFKRVDKSNSVKYTTNVDRIKYSVHIDKAFTSLYKSTWTRSYDDVSNTDFGYSQVNKNPLNIINAITNITEDFLVYKNVDVLIIQHVNMDNENSIIDCINKRAKINYKYLKDIKNYNIIYFNMIAQKISLATTCLLYRCDIDISPIIEHYNKIPVVKYIEIVV